MEEASIAYRTASGTYEAGYLGQRTAHNSFAAACKAAVAAANERRQILEAAIESAKAVRDYAAALSAQINGDN
jgi:superfamily I DNA and RNA helicase